MSPRRPSSEKKILFGAIRLSLLMLLFSQFMFPGWCQTSKSTDWYQFRGPQRNGVSSEQGLLGEWPEGGPKILWTVTGIGQGYSSPIVAEGALYITGDMGDDLVISAFSLDGQKKWSVKNGKAWKGSYPGARASCLYEAGRLYHMNAHGRVVCLDAADGREIWAVDTLERFGARNIKWGMSECLLLDGDRLIVTPGGEKALTAALNKQTGETIWTGEPLRFTKKEEAGGTAVENPREQTDQAGYASPVLMEVEGKRLIAGCSSNNFYCVDAANGKIVWKRQVPAPWEVIATMPLVFGDRIVFSSPDKFGSECFQVRVEGDQVRFDSLWKNDLDNCHGALVYANGRIYGSGYTVFKPWGCLDAESGKILYSKDDLWPGSVIWAENRLYVLIQSGLMLLLEPTEKEFVTRGQFQFEERPKSRDAWAHPVIHQGRLYLRYDDRLCCYDVKKK